jgi:antitoxin ParD1/3/4
MSKNTSITLGKHFESFVAEQIKNGRYASTSELVRAGLRLLEEEEAKLATLRKCLMRVKPATSLNIRLMD